MKINCTEKYPLGAHIPTDQAYRTQTVIANEPHLHHMCKNIKEIFSCMNIWVHINVEWGHYTIIYFLWNVWLWCKIWALIASYGKYTGSLLVELLCVQVLLLSWNNFEFFSSKTQFLFILLSSSSLTNIQNELTPYPRPYQEKTIQQRCQKPTIENRLHLSNCSFPRHLLWNWYKSPSSQSSDKYLYSAAGYEKYCWDNTTSVFSCCFILSCMMQLLWWLLKNGRLGRWKKRTFKIIIIICKLMLLLVASVVLKDDF